MLVNINHMLSSHIFQWRLQFNTYINLCALCFIGITAYLKLHLDRHYFSETIFAGYDCVEKKYRRLKVSGWAKTICVEFGNVSTFSEQSRFEQLHVGFVDDCPTVNKARMKEKLVIVPRRFNEGLLYNPNKQSNTKRCTYLLPCEYR